MGFVYEGQLFLEKGIFFQKNWMGMPERVDFS